MNGSETAGLSDGVFHGLIVALIMPRCFIIFLLTVLCLLPGCKRGIESQAPVIRTIVLLSANGERPYEVAQFQNLMRLVSVKPEVNLISHDAAGNARTQAEQFGRAMQDKPVAILVTPVNALALSDQVDAAVRMGVLVIGLGEAASAMPCSTVLTCDQREMGRMAGDMTVRALIRRAQENGKTEVTGRVVEIRGDELGEISTALHEGFIEMLRKEPGIVVVHDAPGGWTKQGGKDRATEAVRLQGSFDVLYAHNDAMALGAATALGSQRMDVLLIGTDGYIGEEGGMSLVSRGDLDGSIYQPILVDLAWQMIARRLGEPGFTPKPSYRLTPQAITPKNASDLLRDGVLRLPEL